MWNQTKLARVLGVCTATISNWERGVGAVPHDMVQEMSTLFQNDNLIEEL